MSYINRNKVLQRFAHFETFDVKMSGVNEVIHPGPTIVMCLQEAMTIELDDNRCEKEPTSD